MKILLTFILLVVSVEIRAEECTSPEKNCPSEDPSPSPIQGQYPTESLFDFPTSFEDFFRRRIPRNVEGEINSFAEVFYPAIKRKGTPEMRSGINPINVTKIIKSLNRPPEQLSDNELLAAILLHTGDQFTDSELHLERANEALVATRASFIGANQGTEEALKYIAIKMKGQSLGNKVGFLTSFMERLFNNYDHKMPMGEVSNNKMFQEMANDIKGIGAGRDAGVCRHMHLLAVKAARAMGLKMSYGISYPSSNGYHLNMVVSNPENPSETIRFNYQIVTTSRERGSLAIMQGGQSAASGVTYHIWGKDDNPLYFVKNEKGLTLDQMVGGRLDEIDPNLERRSQVTQGGVDSKRVHMRVFHALTPEARDKETVSGMSYRFDVPYSRFFNAEYGVAGYHARRVVSGDSFTNYHSDVNQSGLYLRAKHQLKIPFTKQLTLDSSLILRATGYLSKEMHYLKQKDGTVRPSVPFVPVTLFDGSGNWITKLKLKTSSSETAASIDLSGQLADITANTGATLYMRRVTLEHAQRFRLGNFNLVSHTGVNVVPLEEVDPIILSQMLEASSGRRDQIYSLRYVAPLIPMETPSFIGGSRPRAEMKVGGSFFNGHMETGVNLIYYLPQEFEGTRSREEGLHLVEDEAPAPKIELKSVRERFYRRIPSEYGGQIYLRFNY